MEHKMFIHALHLFDFDKIRYCLSNLWISGANSSTNLANFHLKIRFVTHSKHSIWSLKVLPMCIS